MVGLCLLCTELSGVAAKEGSRSVCLQHYVDHDPAMTLDSHFLR